jgi:hypothetical protein
MRKKLQSLYIVTLMSLSLNVTITYAQNKLDTLRIFLQKGPLPYGITNGTLTEDLGHDYSIYRQKFLKYLNGFPELKQFARKNFWRDIEFARKVVKCYNSYAKAPVKPKADEAYFASFGLYSKKAMRKGPTKEMLAQKKPMGFMIKTTATSTTYTYSTTKTGTYGEKFQGYFTYGNSGFYNKGFLCKNIKRSLGDDKQALKYIRKYRAKWIGRTILVATGVGLSVGVIRLMDSKPFFNLTDDEIPFVAVPAVLILTAMTRGGNAYKTNCIEGAIITYNMNLGLNTSGDRKADSLINLIKPWDYASYGLDTIKTEILKLGPAVAKKIYPLLARPEYAAFSHTMLSIIFNRYEELSFRNIKVEDKVIGQKMNRSGLKWQEISQTDGKISYVINQKSYKKTKKMWRKIIE